MTTAQCPTVASYAELESSSTTLARLEKRGIPGCVSLHESETKCFHRAQNPFFIDRLCHLSAQHFCTNRNRYISRGPALALSVFGRNSGNRFSTRHPKAPCDMLAPGNFNLPSQYCVCGYSNGSLRRSQTGISPMLKSRRAQRKAKRRGWHILDIQTGNRGPRVHNSPRVRR
jgi:hypothetical protein